MIADTAPGENRIRVLVADNSRIYTGLLADALRRDPLLEVIPFELQATELVASAMEQNIDVLIVSSNLDEQSSRGLEILRELRRLYPRTRTILLPDSSKDEAVLQAFRAGARGIFGRNEPMELLSKCVRCVYQGQIWANSRHMSIAVDALANAPTVRAVNANGMSLLSERELQVVQCLAEGMTNREIAKRLELSQHTVKNYFFRIFDKLGVSSRVELLFMSLSHAAEHSSASRAANNGHNGNKYSHYESDLLKKSAEAGLPAAQLALAQMYLTRRSDPHDVVEAYMWYLIATECAMQARGFITKMLTVEQIEEAKRKASVWLASRKQRSASSVNSAQSAVSHAKQPASIGAHSLPVALVDRKVEKF
jgi:two-component system, NarL family, nitrate/nitrite response regulator NarL